MSLHKSLVVQQSSFSEDIVELYDELVGRHDHLRHALEIRKNIENIIEHEKQNTKVDRDKIVTLSRIIESTLWYLTVEIYSRFLSNPAKRNHSKRCLRGLINKIDIESVEKLRPSFEKFESDEAEVIGFITVQRNKYFSHADDISWGNFPRVFNDEYGRLLDNVADILDYARSILEVPRTCSRNIRVSTFV